MRACICIAFGCLVTWAGPGAAPAAAQGVSQEELTTIAKQVEVVAKAWLSGKLDDDQESYRMMMRGLKGVTYDEGSIDALSAVINAPRADPIDLYVANKLLGPLLLAKSDVILKAVPAVKKFDQRVGKYMPLPVYSEENLKPFAYPEGASREQKAAVDQRRKEKLDKEKPIQLHNEQVGLLKKTACELMVLAADANEDQELFQTLKKMEAQGLWAYSDIAEIFRSEARRMPEDRAKALYDPCETLWNHLREEMEQKKLAQKTYADPGTVVLKPAENSTFTQHEDAPTARLLKLINQLAPMARMPALKDPKGGGGREAPKPKPDRPRLPGSGTDKPKTDRPRAAGT